LFGFIWHGAFARAVFLAIALVGASAPAMAQNAIWFGNGAPTADEWNQLNNWSTGGGATITNNGSLIFASNSSAGNAAITSSGSLNFNDSGTAANANISSSGILNFNNTSTAGNAVIINNQNLYFNNNSTVASATITNNSNLSFNDNSTAANATINNNGFLNFNGTSTAGAATLIGGGSTFFRINSSAGSASITVNTSLEFLDASTAGSAAITNRNRLFFFEVRPRTPSSPTTEAWVSSITPRAVRRGSSTMRSALSIFQPAPAPPATTPSRPARSKARGISTSEPMRLVSATISIPSFPGQSAIVVRPASNASRTR